MENSIHSLDVAYEIAPEIGYIKLNRFAETTHEEFKTQLKYLIDKHHITNLILDLRGNSGGYLDQAIKILNNFLVTENFLCIRKVMLEAWKNIVQTFLAYIKMVDYVS